MSEVLILNQIFIGRSLENWAVYSVAGLFFPAPNINGQLWVGLPLGCSPLLCLCVLKMRMPPRCRVLATDPDFCCHTGSWKLPRSAHTFSCFSLEMMTYVTHLEVLPGWSEICSRGLPSSCLLPSLLLLCFCTSILIWLLF